MRSIKRALKNISLRWKFFFGFLITSMVPIVGFGAYAYMNTENILLEQSYSNMEENLARASNNMDMVLEGYENASSLIFMNKQVQDLISVDFTNYGYEDVLLSEKLLRYDDGDQFGCEYLFHIYDQPDDCPGLLFYL